MYHELDDFIKELPNRQPLTHKALYPRRIIPPNGYINPKYFTATLWCALTAGFKAEMDMLPHITTLVNALVHIQYRVPTYFVRSEFAQAVAMTEPPEDFKFSEIKWPLPAMLFVLPTDFVLSYFGFMCPFLSVADAKPGVYPHMLGDLPPCELPLKALNPLNNQVERIAIVYPVYGKDRMPIDYTGTFTMAMNVNEIATAPFEDATYMEEKLFNEHIPTGGIDLPKPEDERAFNMKVQSFAVKLLLALTARPEIIKTGGMARHGKKKKGRVLDTLWNPNLIGWEYRAERTGTAGEHGTHASPRMHWRRGHMRNQPFGPKPWTEATPKRLKWIEPVLINAPEAP